MIKENRRHERIAVDKTTVDLTDGKKIAQDCTVEDISLEGLKVSDIFKNFNYKSDKITCVIFMGGKNYKLKVKPMWGKNKEGGMELGFKLKGIDQDWSDTIYSLTKKGNKDVWGFSD